MKARFKQMWIEHKSKDKKPKDVIKDDTDDALEKMISILSKSPDPKLRGQKEKVTLIKKKTEEIILEKLKKEEDKADINKRIIQTKLLAQDPSNTEGLDSQNKEKKYKKLKKQIFDLEMSLQKLITPKPLEPSEMIEVLLYSSDIDSDLSVKDILKMLDKLSGKTPSHNLIYISDSLVNPILKNHITSKIALRKAFLDQTAKDLSMVTKLPNKPSDLDNISGVVKNLQEGFKNVFTYNQELYKKQIDLLAESLQLLLLIRGKLKIWADVDKFAKQNNSANHDRLVTIVKKAQSPAGGGIFDILGGQELNLLNNLVGKVELLTRDYCSFYNAFFDKSSNSYLLSNINTFRGILIKQWDTGFESLSNLENVKENFFQILKQKETLIQIINSVIGKQESLIVSEYLRVTASRLNNHYHTQLLYTDLAIKELTTIQTTFKQESKYPNKFEIDELYPASFFDIDNYFKNIKITNIILGYVDIKNSATEDYLSFLTKCNLQEKLLSLKSTQHVLNFFNKIFIHKDKIKYFKDFLTVVGLIEINAEVSKFLKIIDVRNELNFEFIQKIIYHLIVDIFKFFGFDNIKSLDSLQKKLIQQKIKEIEKYLVNNTGPIIEDLVRRAISNKSELLDNLSYLITPKNSLKSSKNTNPLKLLNLLISLSEYGEFNPEKLLTEESIHKIITLNQDKIIEVIKEIEDTGQYREHKQSSNSNYGTKDSVLFNLIDLGCINIKIMDEFLKIGIDPNEAYKGRKLLDSIAYQLTKVVREPDFYSMPGIQKYIVSPEKQDQLIDVALYLIHQRADINSNSHKNGFLTTVFSLIPSGQSPYLYKKLLSNQEIISQLDLQEVDLWGRNIAHLFCKDLTEVFDSFIPPIQAKNEIYKILTKIMISKNAHYHLNKQDKEGNTLWHYLASSITADYVKLKTDCSFPQFKNEINLSTQNFYFDTPLHIAFTKKANPAAFYEFVLTDIYPPAQWLKVPRLSLTIKNKEHQTVLDLIIKSKSNFIASIINTYMAVVNYEIDLDDDCTFETIRSKVDTFLKGIPQFPTDEMGRTMYLGKNYSSTKYDSSSSSSSLSSSSSSSMPSSFSSSFPSHLTIGLDMETEYDWHPKTPLGDSSVFTLHG